MGVSGNPWLWVGTHGWQQVLGAHVCRWHPWVLTFVLLQREVRAQALRCDAEYRVLRLPYRVRPPHYPSQRLQVRGGPIGGGVGGSDGAGGGWGGWGGCGGAGGGPTGSPWVMLCKAGVGGGSPWVMLEVMLGGGPKG